MIDHKSLEDVKAWLDSFEEKPLARRQSKAHNASKVFLERKDFYLDLLLTHAYEELVYTRKLKRPERAFHVFVNLDRMLNVFDQDELSALDERLKDAEAGDLFLNDFRELIKPLSWEDYNYVRSYIHLREVAERVSLEELLCLLALCVAFGKTLSLLQESIAVESTEPESHSTLERVFSCSESEVEEIKKKAYAPLLDWDLLVEAHRESMHNADVLVDFEMSSSGATDSTSNPNALTLAETVIAFNELLIAAGYGGADNAAKARFISAITGLSVSNLTKRLGEPFKGSNKYRKQRAEKLIPIFQEIGARKIITNLKKEL